MEAGGIQSPQAIVDHVRQDSERPVETGIERGDARDASIPVVGAKDSAEVPEIADDGIFDDGPDVVERKAVLERIGVRDDREEGGRRG